MITLRMSTFLLKNTTASFVRVVEFLQAAASSGERSSLLQCTGCTALTVAQLGVQTALETPVPVSLFFMRPLKIPVSHQFKPKATTILVSYIHPCDMQYVITAASELVSCLDIRITRPSWLWQILQIKGYRRSHSFYLVNKSQPGSEYHPDLYLVAGADKYE